MADRLFWVSLSYATFGLVVAGDQVVEAPPIAQWATGKSVAYVLRYFRSKGAQILEVPGVSA